MWPRFGIKIGNSTLCVASSKEDKKLEVIANKHGDRVSQAYLLYDGDEIEIGLTAKQKMASKSSATVCNNFQLFRDDLTDEEITNATKYIPCRYDSKASRYELQQQGEDVTKSFSPHEVCIEFFKGSFELARQCHLADDHPLVVLSIPHYYPPQSWENLAKAAEEAGFNVGQVIAEPTAAVLAYELAETDDEGSKRVLCIKSGGILTSFTLFEVGNGLYTILDSAGPFYIGGKQFTDVLIEFIAKEFYKKYRLDPQESRRSMAKIRTAADNCKHILTTLPSTQIYVDSLMDGVDFNIQMSRARFENILQPVLNEFTAIMTAALDKMGIESKKVDEIVLAGATMKIPRLQSTISNYFSEAKLHNVFPPDEVVAIGCARQSLYVNPEDQELELDMKCTCTTSNIYIWHEENSSQQQLFVKKGTLLPSQVIVEVERSPTATKLNKSTENDDDEEAAIFHIKSEDNVSQIKLIGARAVQGIFRITGKIDECDGWPLVKLSC